MSCWRATFRDLQQRPCCKLRVIFLQILLTSSVTATTRLRGLQATPEVCYSLYALYSGDGPEPSGPTAWRYSKSECMPIETQLAAALNAAVKALQQPLAGSIQPTSGVGSIIDPMAQAFDPKGCILGDEQQGYLGVQVCGSFRSAQDAQALSEWLVYGDNGAVLVNKLTRLGGGGRDPVWCAEEPGGATTASDSSGDASSSSGSSISMTAACILPAIAVPSNRPPPSTYVFSLTTMIEPRPPWAFVAPEHVITPFSMSTHV